MAKEAIVLGAGIVGVSTALNLLKRGWRVALVDRLPPGEGTSHGNAGIIQREAVEPYPMPLDLRSLRNIALRRTNDVHYRYRDLPAHARALARYWSASRPLRFREIAKAYESLVVHSLSEHETLIDEASAGHLVSRSGYRVLYRAPAAMEAALNRARRYRDEYGLSIEEIPPDVLRRREPALLDGGAGALHWLDPWSVSDPGQLVKLYSALAGRLDGTITIGDAATLRRKSGTAWTIETREGTLEAPNVVVCLGPWTNELLSRFGYHFVMLRKRGYHRHYRPEASLEIPVLDAEFGYVMAPMSAGLRITTGAHLAQLDSAVDHVQLARSEAAARDLIKLGEPAGKVWSGTRPCMTDMLPVVGRLERASGLWANFGHGHQGFTLGPATGALLAAMMSDDKPIVDPAPFRADRTSLAA